MSILKDGSELEFINALFVFYLPKIFKFLKNPNFIFYYQNVKIQLINLIKGDTNHEKGDIF